MNNVAADRHFAQIVWEVHDPALLHPLLDGLVLFFRNIEMKLYRSLIFIHDDPPWRKSDYAVVMTYDHIVQHDSCR